MPARRSAVAVLAALGVVLVYILTKALSAGSYWFDGIAQWSTLFRPFPDWGSGAALYGALLPAKWIGTRTAMHAAAFLATVIVALCMRAYRLPAFFACEAAFIEMVDLAWLAGGERIGWAPAAAVQAMLGSGIWAALLLAAAWIWAGQASAPPRVSRTPPPHDAGPPFAMLSGLIDRYFIYVCYVVAVAYAVMKLVFAYWWWFDSTGFWLAAFRPFDDWGTGAMRFGAILPARWIGTRNLAYGLFILFGVWLSVRRGESRLLGLLLLQGALIEFFDGFWLANGKFNYGWTGQNTDFYMRGGFLWIADLMLVGIYTVLRPSGPGAVRGGTGSRGTSSG